MKNLCENCMYRTAFSSRDGYTMNVCNFYFIKGYTRTSVYKEQGQNIKDSYGKEECLLHEKGERMRPLVNPMASAIMSSGNYKR